MKVIKIGAVWCGSCISMKSKWKDIESNYNINTINYDYDINEDEVKKYNIGDKLPVAIFLDDNDHELCRLIGEKNKQDIVDIIEKYK